jgi:hypothetical protein
VTIAASNGTGLRARIVVEDAAFDTFWAAYPRQVGKDAARAAWRKRNPTSELVTQILAALEWQRRSDQWIRDGGRFVPNPATWLNQGRWQDEPSTTPHVSKQTIALGRAGEAFLGSKS